MITEKEIIEILNRYSGYVDRSRAEQAVSEVNFELVAKEIFRKLRQHNVSVSVQVPRIKIECDTCDNAPCSCKYAIAVGTKH